MIKSNMRVIRILILTVLLAVTLSACGSGGGGSGAGGENTPDNGILSQFVISFAYVNTEENRLIIMGKNLDSESVVTLGDLPPLSIESYSPNEIVATLPGAENISGIFLLTVHTGSLLENYDAYSLSIGTDDSQESVDHDQLLIRFLSIDSEENTLIITGYNFDNGVSPTVIFGGYDLPVVSYNANEIVVELPAFIDISEDTLLQVQTGGDLINSDTFSLVRLVAEISTLSEDTSCNSCWKEGPPDTNMWTGGQWGEPVYYQVLNDYTVDLPSYFTDYWALPLGYRKYLDELFYIAENELPYVNNVLNFLELTSSGILTIKKGYRWDGPSTEPVPHFPIITHASLVHDALYDLMRLGEIERDWDPFTALGYWNRMLADNMFYMIARDDGYFRPLAWSDFKIIRAGGWMRVNDAMPSWKKHAVADAGPDQTIACAVPVSLNGSNSRFATEWIWNWSDTGGIHQATGEIIDNISLDPGTHLVTLTVDDGNDDDDGPYRDSDNVRITVNPDNEPPVITGISEPLTVWPPHHEYKTFTIEDFVTAVSDDCTALSLDDLMITKVTSDEPEDEEGDGHTEDDIVIAPDGKSVDLRIERDGGGDGRLYTISIEAVDESGNATTELFQVQVTHHRDCVVDDGSV